MSSIIERNGRFLVRVRRQGYPTATKTFTRRSDAVSWGRRVEADMEAGRWQLATKRVPTLCEVIQEYRQVVAPRQKGALTYRYRFDELARLPFSSKPVNEVLPADVARWRDQQLHQHKPATVTRKLAMLSSIFSWAWRERGWVAGNVLSAVSKPRQGEGRARTLSSEEIDWLLQAALTSKAKWLHPALVVLMCSAMRRGELCSLRRQDIDFEAATAHLSDTKNGSARDVPLCPDALSAMRQLAAAAEAECRDLLVPIGPCGSLSTRFTVTVRRAQRMYKDVCLEQGQEPQDGFLSDLRLHDLRHHAVTAWTATGALSLAELMSISGHKSTRMLIRYTHLQAKYVAAKLASLPAQARRAATPSRPGVGPAACSPGPAECSDEQGRIAAT